jgi:ribonuclease HII
VAQAPSGWAGTRRSAGRRRRGERRNLLFLKKKKQKDFIRCPSGRRRYTRAMPRPAPRVAGVDEVGRGPLAGPVFAAAVILPRRTPSALLALLDDSKKLTPEARDTAYLALRAAPGVEIAVAAASVAEIARLNILHATLLAMRRAVLRLAPDLALVDGNTPPRLDCPIRCIVGGDALEPAISAASIVAKVLRDRLMARLDFRYPGYGWASNAGYATTDHRAALHRLGPTRHHRAAFGTVRQLSLNL